MRAFMRCSAKTEKTLSHRYDYCSSSTGIQLYNNNATIQRWCYYERVKMPRLQCLIYPCCSSSPSFANNRVTVPFRLLFSLQHLLVSTSLYSHNNVPLLMTEPSFTLNLTTTAFSGQFTIVIFAIIARVSTEKNKM